MNIKCGALVGAGAGHFHVAAMFADDLLGDVEAEADAFLAVAGGAADAGIFGEQLVYFIWGHVTTDQQCFLGLSG